MLKIKVRTLIMLLLPILFWVEVKAQSEKNKVPQSVMQDIYQQIKTPFKYGLVKVPETNATKMDCPSVFKKGGKWYMTYLIFDGRGYETWLAKSNDLLHWETKGRIISFSDSTNWDGNQKAGYIDLEDFKWEGSYKWRKFDHKYWMSYFGGNTRGYEAGLLSLGMAFTRKNPKTVQEWQRLDQPILKATDTDARWWENHTLYKTTVIWDKEKHTGYPFVMYYNANGDSLNKKRGAERIGMAVSNDMTHWKRFMKDPVLDHHTGITGDPYIQKIGNVYVMFYFGAFYKGIKGASNHFACSYDLINWTDWTGAPLIEPSEIYDEVFAHKSFVLKYRGVVYHYYCAVNKLGQRGIAVATSKDFGKSTLNFIYKKSKSDNN